MAVGNWSEAGLLTGFPVTPGLYNEIATHRNWGHLAWVSLGFRLWRGTIKYRIALAKTSFHGGQLTVVYQPWGYDDEPTSTRQCALNHRIIWDTAQSASLEFEVPYASPLPWTDVYYDNGNLYDYETNSCGRTGMITIFADTGPIISADAAGGGLVAPNVPYVIYCWSDDIEFAVPSLTTYSAGPASPFFQPQIGPWGNSTPAGELCGPPTSMYRANPISAVTNSSCVGESVPNLRLLTRRQEVIASVGDVPSATLRFNDLIQDAPIMRWLAPMYVFFTGGCRFTYVVSDDGSSGRSVLVTRLYRESPNFPVCAQIVNVNKGTVAMFDLPWQANVPFVATDMYMTDNPRNMTDSIKIQPLDVFGPGNLSPGYIFASGADDFTFGCLRAPPRTLTSTPILAPPYGEFAGVPNT